MNIIEQARDVDEYLRNRQIEDAWEAADLMAVHFAEAVDRAAKLADELEYEADEHPADDDSLDENYRTAARIRAALEGVEE